MIDVVNRIADEPDPTSRFKMLVHELRRHLPQGVPTIDAVLDELDEKSVFFTSAIVSGGHVHEMSVTFDGIASGGIG